MLSFLTIIAEAVADTFLDTHSGIEIEDVAEYYNTKGENLDDLYNIGDTECQQFSEEPCDTDLVEEPYDTDSGESICESVESEVEERYIKYYDNGCDSDCSICVEITNKLKEKYDDMYDGELIFREDYEETEDSIILHSEEYTVIDTAEESDSEEFYYMVELNDAEESDYEEENYRYNVIRKRWNMSYFDKMYMLRGYYSDKDEAHPLIHEDDVFSETYDEGYIDAIY